MNVEILKKFAAELTDKFKLPGSAAPEDQLKGSVAEVFTAAGLEFGYTVNSRTETHLSEHKVRPDIAIYVAKLMGRDICGSKAPRVRVPMRQILKRREIKSSGGGLKGSRTLSTLMAANGRYIRDGQKLGNLIRFKGDPSTDGIEAVTNEDAEALGSLLHDFLGWKPIVPHRPTELAKYLAPLTRFLRAEVEVAVRTVGSNIEALAAEWRNFFFPTADDKQFSDAYAQTVTYAMLLARLSGAEKLDAHDAAKVLDKGNKLLARTLELLGQPGARDELRVGFELLQRSLEALNPAIFLKSKPDLWLYFL